MTPDNIKPKPSAEASGSARAAAPRTKPSSLIKYSFLQILTGSDLSRRRLGLMEARGLKSGPTVWLTACMHGDEVGGMVVIHEIFNQLRQIPLARGRLLAFPLMNPTGFETRNRHLPLSEEDLNRVFPGHPRGSFAQRLADLIFSQICETKPAAVLDLHNDWNGALPYAVLDPPGAGEAPEMDRQIFDLALQSGLPIVRESADTLETIPAERTLSGSLRRRGIPALTLELGEANKINEHDVQNGVRAIWRILSKIGLVSFETPPPDLALPDPVRAAIEGRELFYTHQPTSSTTGVIRFQASTGTLVKSGQKIARVFNTFGKPVETLTAPGAALVLGQSDSAVAHPGAPVMAFALLDKPAQ